MTIRFRTVLWGCALHLILGMYNCGYVVEGNVLWIAPLAKIAASAPAATRKSHHKKPIRKRTPTPPRPAKAGSAGAP